MFPQKALRWEVNLGYNKNKVKLINSIEHNFLVAAFKILT